MAENQEESTINDTSVPKKSKQKESWASSEATRHSMQGNKGRDTKPELAVRKILFSHGFRFRVIYKPIKHVQVSADIAFVKAKTLVMIDGCYWHGCPEHYKLPHTNLVYWQQKILRNKERDMHTNLILRDAGWTVLRYWEHEKPEDIAEDIERHVKDYYPSHNSQSK
jgi:DNA mismatch endonuclease (patch repair protein)